MTLLLLMAIWVGVDGMHPGGDSRSLNRPRQVTGSRQWLAWPTPLWTNRKHWPGMTAKASA